MNIQTRPTVFIPNKSAHDFSQAEKFGELKFVTQGSVDRYAVNSMCRIFAETMRDSQPQDYILITGLAVLCSIACAIQARKYGRLNLLVFHRGNEYVERNVILDEVIGLEEASKLPLEPVKL